MHMKEAESYSRLCLWQTFLKDKENVFRCYLYIILRLSRPCLPVEPTFIVVDIVGYTFIVCFTLDLWHLSTETNKISCHFTVLDSWYIYKQDNDHISYKRTKGQNVRLNHQIHLPMPWIRINHVKRLWFSHHWSWMYTYTKCQWGQNILLPSVIDKYGDNDWYIICNVDWFHYKEIIFNFVSADRLSGAFTCYILNKLISLRAIHVVHVSYWIDVPN